MNFPQLQQKTFLFLLVGVTLAFLCILWPFYSAVFWGTVIAILFTPFYRWLTRVLHDRRNLAALITLFLVLVVVIMPLIMIAGSLAREGAIIFAKIHSGQVDFGAYFSQMISVLPHWAVNLLNEIGVTDIPALQHKLSTGAVQASQLIATKAFSIGQNTFQFVIDFGIMLYLAFFLLRDGGQLSARIRGAVPLSMEQKRQLFGKFTTVVRATVKGNVAVAVAQGTLGGFMFWFLGIQGALLWAVLMGFLSLLPAVGAGLVWAPVAVYFLVTGAIWQGVTLIVFGVVVIGLVDNILRPLLVGKDTQMPDYVVLISTLGGMGLFGLNGFVIGPVIAAMFIAVWDLFTSTKESFAA